MQVSYQVCLKFIKFIWAATPLVDLILSFLLRSMAWALYKEQFSPLIDKIQSAINSRKEFSHPDILIKVLIQAEDHRFCQHYGFDIRAIVRSIVITLFTSRRQGGSTITQQLIRVITSDFRPSLERKFKELCLAAWLDSQLTKNDQAVAYLHIAYYGWKMNGLEQAARRLNIDFPCSRYEAVKIIARLKYPEPRSSNEYQMRKIKFRENHIIGLMDKNE